MAPGIGWTRGALCQANLLDTLAGLPPELRLRLPDSTSVSCSARLEIRPRIPERECISAAGKGPG
jgi:hypothetical protein